jgi:hypothetical protein
MSRRTVSGVGSGVALLPEQTQAADTAVARTVREGLARAQANLRRANISTAANTAALLAHENPESLASALTLLNTSKILTEENKAVVLAHSNPYLLAYALVSLSQAKILTAGNRAALLAHENPESLANALILLNTSRILTEANKNAVLAHENPYGLADAIGSLHRAKILTAESWEAVVTHATPGLVADVLIGLTRQDASPVLMKKFEFVLEKENPALIRYLVKASHPNLRKNVLRELVRPILERGDYLSRNRNQNHAVILGCYHKYACHHFSLFNRDARKVAIQHLMFPEKYEFGRSGESTINAWQPYL